MLHQLINLLLRLQNRLNPEQPAKLCRCNPLRRSTAFSKEIAQATPRRKYLESPQVDRLSLEGWQTPVAPAIEELIPPVLLENRPDELHRNRLAQMGLVADLGLEWPAEMGPGSREKALQLMELNQLSQEEAINQVQKMDKAKKVYNPSQVWMSGEQARMQVQLSRQGVR